ncbi:cytochrome P450 [Streptomyces sp. SL13]|uniref:Cytochrome P450 n=1 Tax=Streptantibioticus silvisoli TaxID=2705255 RepID=A0AA90KGM9_9ACTN|nr:cytochrome P450 [Streptantibioticus silvisoli]MDI5970785.1 cytochrome P450 [Streptantibioticus silvisoli]
MKAQDVLFSIFTPEGRENPFPALARLREIAPAYYDGDLDMVFLTSYADCQSVLSDPSFATPDAQWCRDRHPEWREHPSAEFFYSSLLLANDADHSRLRRLVGRGFTPRRVAALEPAVLATTDRLLDGLADAASHGSAADFQELVGLPLPVSVVGDLIGVPATDQPGFSQLGQDATRLLEPVRSPEDWVRTDRAVGELRSYFLELLAHRERRPADDLTSALLEAGDEDTSRAELADLLLLVFVAGFETTTSLLGLTVHALLRHPDQLGLLLADPGAVPGSVEESLRWDGPVHMTERVARRATRIRGVEVPRGASVTTVLSAANRDPQEFADPDRFDVRRTGTRLLSFAAGPHFCMGAALARLEASVLVRRLFERFPGLAPAGPPVRRDSVTLRSFDRLPVTVRAVAAA